VKILVFGAHPDDVEIGMGGTIARYADMGHHVTIALVCVPNERTQRVTESERAAEILGAELMVLGIDPDGIYHDRKLVNVFDRVYQTLAPDIVYTHWLEDSHQDHVAVARASVSATRKNKCSVYMYEQTIPGGLGFEGFHAQKYVDITPAIERKTQSILAHETQVAKNGDWWLRGVEGRAMYRGYQMGVKYAETFQVIKEIFEIPPATE
jgi:LmbE family N-acetylglucosaminyl deacetylase